MASKDELTIKITAKDATAKGVDSAEKKLNSLEGMATRAMRSMVGLFAVERVASYTVELVKLGGELQGVERAFYRIADTKYLEELKRATHGTVSELELMRRAVQADNFDIPLSSLAKLFEFATSRSRDTGESVDYLVNSIIMGIGRKSPLILDNLGISAVQLRQRLKGVGTEAASIGDIARVVGDIAAEAMEKVGGVVDDEGIAIQRANAQWQDLKANWSQLLQESGTIGFVLGKINDDLEMANSELPWYEKFWYRITMQHKKGAEAARDYAKEQSKLTEKTKNAAHVNLDEITITARRITTYEGLKKQIKEQKDLLEKADITDKDYIQTIYKEIAALEKKKAAFEALANPVVNRPAAPAKMQSIGAPELADTTPSLQHFDDESMTKATEWAKEKVQKMYAEIQAEIDRLNADLNMSIASGFASGLETAFSGSNIEGILGAFLTPIANFLIQEGVLLVAHGLAVEAFKKSLESLNGVGAIAAGAAMIATGAAFKGFVGGGIGGGGGNAYSGGGNGYTNYQPRAQANNNVNVVVSGKLVADGKDMVWNAEKNDYIINRTIGS
uniref:hypothetical protein n=1 Tax=uncultured Draconibacterium sp. TaxID=1573823 RepID=UPI003216D193